MGFATNRSLTPLAINTAASGDNTLIPGVAGKVIDVYRIAFTLAGAGTITLKDGASNALSGPMSAGALVLEDTQEEPTAIYTTSPGNGFVANLSGANQLSGTIWYRYETH